MPTKHKEKDSVEIIDLSSGSEGEEPEPIKLPRRQVKKTLLDEQGNPYTLPTRVSKDRKPRKPLTEEQKQELRERLVMARAKREEKRAMLALKEKQMYEEVNQEGDDDEGSYSDEYSEEDDELDEEEDENQKSSKKKVSSRKPTRVSSKAKKQLETTRPAKPRKPKKPDAKALKIAELEEKISLLTSRTKEIRARKPTTKTTQIILQPPSVPVVPVQASEKANKVLDFFSR